MPKITKKVEKTKTEKTKEKLTKGKLTKSKLIKGKLTERQKIVNEAKMFDIQPDKNIIHYYDCNGQVIVHEDNVIVHEDEVICATHEERNRDNDAFWVRYGRSGIYHPQKTESREVSQKNYWKMIRVSKSVFDAYLSFLQTKKDMYYVQAGRRLGEARPGGLHG